MNREWLREGLRSGVRGLVLAVLSQLANVVLFVLTLVAFALSPVGVGIFLLPPVLTAVRRLAESHRRWAREWSGVDIPSPYRPAPLPAGNGQLGFVRRCRWLLSDPATWRDLLWLVLEVPVGLVLGLIPVTLLVYGVEGVLLIPIVVSSVVPWYGYGAIWPIDTVLEGLLSAPQGLLVLGLGLTAGPWALRQHALFAQRLLVSTRVSALAQRVRQLTHTRAETVDAQATELRRIERDLHDGAQARLVSLSMSIGLAEELMARDPDAARRLMAEARETSGEALVELRGLVRGIHPPVLAERGLAGAVQALALALPLRVDVSAELPGRPEAPLESAAYFAVAEALANVAKHSGADRAWVSMAYADGRLTMRVGDNGAGGAGSDSGGTGLAGIVRRLGAFDGTMAVTSPPGGPTVVTMELPCEL